MIQQKYMTEESMYKRKVILICLVVFVVAILAYANTITGDFVWDDEYLILNNSNIKSFTHLPDVFKNYAGYGSGNVNNFYRPLQEVSNMIDYAIWGEKPAGFHMTNILLHGLVAALVFILLLYLAGDLLTAALAALLYAIHPIHTEAVAYIAGRADPLYAIFMLLSLILFIKVAKWGNFCKKDLFLYILSLIMYVFSVLCKEIAIIMPLIVGIYIVFFLKGTQVKERYDRIKFSWVPYAVISCIYAIIRTTVLDFSSVAPESLFRDVPLFLRLLTFLRSIGIYMRVLVLPVDLHMERTLTIAKSVVEAPSLIAIGALLLVAGAVWYAYKRSRIAAFAVVWFFVYMLPFSNIIPLNTFIAEHWIYMASIGPFLLVAMGIVWLFNNITSSKIKITLICTVGVILGMYATITVIRNSEWSDEVEFYENTLKYHPNNTRVYLNLGNAYYERGDIPGAIIEYQKALALDKNYAVAYGNIGTATLRLGNLEVAEKYLTKAIMLKPYYPIAYYNLGLVRFERKSYSQALRAFKTATEQMPQFHQAWEMVGRSYMELGEPLEARKAFDKSLEIFPDQGDLREIRDQI